MDGLSVRDLDLGLWNVFAKTVDDGLVYVQGCCNSLIITPYGGGT